MKKMWQKLVFLSAFILPLYSKLITGNHLNLQILKKNDR